MISDFRKMTLREFLQNYKDFYIIFEVENPEDEYNMEYEGLEEFETGGYSFLLDEVGVGDLTSMTIYPQAAQIRILFERDPVN